MKAYIVYADQKGEWRWRYRADNNEIIGVSSEGYVHKSDCLRAIELMKDSKDAPVYGAPG